MRRKERMNGPPAGIAPYIIQGLLSLVFFLYLSRPEVRERLR